MESRSFCLIALVVIAVLAYAGCEPGVTSSSAAGRTKPVAAGPKTASQNDWQDTLAEARKEGELVVYWGVSPEVHQKVARELKQGFGITMSVWGASSMEQAERMARESQAGINNVDVTITGHNATLLLSSRGLIRPLKDVLILSEVLDGNNWFQGELPFWAGGYEVGFGGAVNSGVWRNTDLVREGEIREYGDLLKPQYKGKIVLGDPSVSGSGPIWFRNFYLVLGDAFMKALAGQEPLPSRDRRLPVEWLARGKYPLLVAGTLEELFYFKKMGSPIKGIETKEGDYIHTGTNSIAVATRPAHPNAARAFTNWMLSREGQTLWSQAVSIPSFRVDVPTGHLDPASVPQRGKIYLSDTAETYARSGEYLALARQLFAQILK